MFTLVMIWVVLGCVTLSLALYRHLVTMREENYVHLAAGEERHIPEQVAMAHKMEVIDHWGKSLTIVTIIVGLALAIVYLYQQWLLAPH
jgi:hypothetical protein